MVTILHYAVFCTTCDLVQSLSYSVVMVKLQDALVVDSDLTFTDHITHASKRALGSFRALCRFIQLLPESANLWLIESLVFFIAFLHMKTVSPKQILTAIKEHRLCYSLCFQLIFDHVSVSLSCCIVLVLFVIFSFICLVYFNNLLLPNSV